MKSNGKRAHEMCILHRSSGLCRNSSLTQNIHFMHALSPLKFMFLFKKIDFTLLRISARRQKTLLFGRDSEETLCQISRALTGAFRIQFAWFLAQYICVFQWTRRCSVLRTTRTDEVKRVLSCVLTQCFFAYLLYKFYLFSIRQFVN